MCVCVCVFGGVNQAPADSELSYHYRSLALRVHLDWEYQFAASIEFRLYALFKICGSTVASPSHHVVVHK